jgi:hypothetical protein
MYNSKSDIETAILNLSKLYNLEDSYRLILKQYTVPTALSQLSQLLFIEQFQYKLALTQEPNKDYSIVLKALQDLKEHGMFLYTKN